MKNEQDFIAHVKVEDDAFQIQTVKEHAVGTAGLSDFANILMVYCNLPLQYLGLKYVTRAWKHFEKQDGTPFTSEIAGIDVPVWEEKAGKA